MMPVPLQLNNSQIAVYQAPEQAQTHALLIYLFIYLICQKDRVAPKGRACMGVLPLKIQK